MNVYDDDDMRYVLLDEGIRNYRTLLRQQNIFHSNNQDFIVVLDTCIPEFSMLDQADVVFIRDFIISINPEEYSNVHQEEIVNIRGALNVQLVHLGLPRIRPRRRQVRMR